ncbi:hypothetical protein PLEOSDRAFT_1110929 [Pleurotus ostreatus PC15]|uniref:DUF1766-domain-containing protein n=1 Tax=Pleurotus ostreatus (strain PC15) TaxID=1137138 RepID=A0A067NUH9_PLEO1|nr:hypothetical protein PLEOSDRAFT_1110929 [Pleurotus ostreatus PC15]
MSGTVEERGSKSDAFKGITQKLFGKLAAHLDAPKESEDKPSTPLRYDNIPDSLKPSRPPYQPHNGYNSAANLVGSFDALSLTGRPPQPHSNSDPGTAFVGGFYAPPPIAPNQPPPSAPDLRLSGADGFAPGPLPRPPAMPLPYQPQPQSYDQSPPKTSLTMQYALQAPDQQHRPFPPQLNTPPSRPVSSSMLPSKLHDLNLYAAPVAPKKDSKPQAISHSVTISSDSSDGSYTASPKPSKKAARRRVSSDPPASAAPSTSKGDGTSVQCNGTTKAGKRCTRQVARDANTTGDVFCHQHSREVLASSGFFGRKNGEWVKFEDWIPSYLQPDTQVMLRSEMEKAKTSSDVPGYIYTFEILDLDAPTVKLKVGRAVNLVKRIDEWSKQCSSKEQVLRGWYPGVVESEDGDDDGGISLLKGKVRAGTKCPLCHRLERLVHLELADLAFAQAYLDPSWPDVSEPPEVSGNTTSTPKNKGRTYVAPCPDCGQLHKEIFEFKRVKKGRYKNKEWELIVKPVIEKWGAFVESYV